ncbi:MAG: phosphoribosyl-ATP diphosphatase [Xanthobacteraceae bacterium]|nr:phosphoribosyl-ATP diphosphatase [Xanthobacteraceae bacterium]
MSDSLDRLYQAVLAARDRDPAVSRTAKLFRQGPSKMARKVAEEAMEVVIDAVSDKADGVVRESADLLYNLAVLWAAMGVTPADVWREMDRREVMLGIAEKLPKEKLPKEKSPKSATRPASKPVTPPGKAYGALARRPIVAREGGQLLKRR